MLGFISGLFQSPEQRAYPLEGQHQNDGTNADTEATAIAESARTIRTTDAVPGFVWLSDEQVSQVQQQLKARKKASANFQKFLSAKLSWEELDGQDTNALQTYYAHLLKVIQLKRGSVSAKRVAQQALRQNDAKMVATFEAAKAKADEVASIFDQKQLR